MAYPHLVDRTSNRILESPASRHRTSFIRCLGLLNAHRDTAVLNVAVAPDGCNLDGICGSRLGKPMPRYLMLRLLHPGVELPAFALSPSATYT